MPLILLPIVAAVGGQVLLAAGSRRGDGAGGAADVSPGVLELDLSGQSRTP